MHGGASRIGLIGCIDRIGLLYLWFSHYLILADVPTIQHYIKYSSIYETFH